MSLAPVLFFVFAAPQVVQLRGSGHGTLCDPGFSGHPNQAAHRLWLGHGMVVGGSEAKLLHLG